MDNTMTMQDEKRMLDLPVCAPHTPLDTARLYARLARVPRIPREGGYALVLRTAGLPVRRPTIIG